MSDPNLAPIPAATLAWVTASIGPGARVLDVTAMSKASHTNHRIHAETSTGAGIDLVLRRYTDHERLSTDAWYVPAHEIAAMEALESADLPVPRLVAADPDPTDCDVPTLVVTWLPGAPPGDPKDLATFLRALATPLPVIHAVPTSRIRRAYATYFASDGITLGDLRPPPRASDPSMWERSFAALEGPPPRGPETFIHRDYHHGNTLWQEAELTGIVDWTTGCIGPPGIDVAHERLNLAWDFGIEAADAFLLEAEEAGIAGIHPYWDLLAGVDWASEMTPENEDEAARYLTFEAFVARALSELA